MEISAGLMTCLLKEFVKIRWPGWKTNGPFEWETSVIIQTPTWVVFIWNPENSGFPVFFPDFRDFPSFSKFRKTGKKSGNPEKNPEIRNFRVKFRISGIAHENHSCMEKNALSHNTIYKHGFQMEYYSRAKFKQLCQLCLICDTHETQQWLKWELGYQALICNMNHHST